MELDRTMTGALHCRAAASPSIGAPIVASDMRTSARIASPSPQSLSAMHSLLLENVGNRQWPRRRTGRPSSLIYIETSYGVVMNAIRSGGATIAKSYCRIVGPRPNSCRCPGSRLGRSNLAGRRTAMRSNRTLGGLTDIRGMVISAGQTKGATLNGLAGDYGAVVNYTWGTVRGAACSIPSIRYCSTTLRQDLARHDHERCHRRDDTWNDVSPSRESNLLPSSDEEQPPRPPRRKLRPISLCSSRAAHPRGDHTLNKQSPRCSCSGPAVAGSPRTPSPVRL